MKILPGFVIILVVFRFLNLGDFPIFGDETLYLSLSDQLRLDNLFSSLEFGVMPGFIWLLKPVLLLFGVIFNPLTSGRILNVLFDLGSAFLIFSISRKLINSNYGLITAIIYLLLPLNFLQSRLVLLDTSVNFFILLGTYFLVDLMEKIEENQNYFKTFLISICFIISYFIKPTAVVYLFIFVLIPFFYSSQNKFNLKKTQRYFSISIICFLLTVFIILIFYLPTARFFERHLTSFDLTTFKTNIWRSTWWLEAYFTNPLLGLTIFSGILALLRKNWFIILLWIWILSVIIFEALTFHHFYPRHLYPLTIAISLIVGYLIYQSLNKQKYLGMIIFILVSLPSLSFIYKIVNYPTTAPIALEDRQQYFEDWTAGVGFKELSQDLPEINQNKTAVLFTDGTSGEDWIFTRLYPMKNFLVLAEPSLNQREFLSSTILNNYPDYQKYLLLNRNFLAPEDWPVQLIRSYPRGQNRNLNLYKLIN